MIVSGNFPGPPTTVALRDIGTGPSSWTAGASNVVTLSGLGITLITPWIISGYSLSFTGALTIPAAGTKPVFGRLGSLYGGLTTDTAPAVSFPPWKSPVIFPSDLSLIGKLWDGTSDPPFPSHVFGVDFGSGAAATVPIESTNSLPQPLQITSGDQLAIGLWLAPSLVQGVAIDIITAAWTITYTEGPTPPVTQP